MVGAFLNIDHDGAHALGEAIIDVNAQNHNGRDVTRIF